MKGSDATALALATWPFIAKKTIHLDVLDLTFGDPTLAQQPFPREAEPAQQARRRPVACIDLGFQPAQAHDGERAADQRLERLVHETATPVGAPQGIAQLGASAPLLESEHKASADGQA